MSYKTVAIQVSHDANNKKAPYRIRFMREDKPDLFPKSETAMLTAVKRATRDNKE